MSQAKTSYQKAGFLVVFVVLTASIVNTMGGLVNPTIATMANAYPDVPLSTIQLVSTLPMFAGIPTSLFAGKIINKLGAKWTLISSFSIFMIASVIPTVFRTNFMPILVCRVISGLASGVITPVNSTLVNTYIEPERRPAMFGYKQGIGNATGIVLTSLVGIIAAKNIYNIWYLHLLLILPIALGLLLPKAPQWDAHAAAAAAESAAPVKEKTHIPGGAWVIIVLMFLFSVFSYPAFLYLSSLIEANGMGDAALSGFVSTASNVGGVVGTLFFGLVYKKLGKHIVPVYMLLLVVNYFLFAFTKSVPLYFVANFVGGIGYFGLFVAFTTGLSVNCSSNSFSVATGIMAAMMNVGIFLSSFIMDFITSISGQAGNLAFPFIVCGGVFAVIAVALFAKPLKM